MSWSAYSGSTGYSWILFQATTSTAAGYPISTGTTSSSTTSATYTGLTTGYYYYFAVYSTATINSAYGTSTASLFTAVLPTGGSIVLNTLTVSSGTVTITAASNATSYRVYISTSTSLTNSVYSFTTSTTGSTVGFTPSPSLVVSTTYYAIVIPTNASGNGSTAFSSGLTPSIVLPTGGSISFNSSTNLISVSVTITAATNATYYTVYISTTQSYTGSVYNFDTATTGSAIIFSPSPSLTLSTTYYAIVRPRNSLGSGSDVYSVVPLLTSTPTGGSIVLNSITSTTTGTVTITAASGATNYTVYISTTQLTSGSVYTFNTTTTGTPVGFTTINPLTIATYYAIVLPTNSFGNGTLTASVSSITTSVPTGGSITLNSVSGPTTASVTITAATGAINYTVYMSTTTSYTNYMYYFTTTTTGIPIVVTPSPNPFVVSTTYYAIVLPTNSFGNGSYSYSSSITTSYPTGGSVTLNSIPTSTSGTVTITAATGATTYTVYISTTQSYTGSVYSFDTTTTGSAVGFTPSPALGAATYYAIVLPKNLFGDGSYSTASSPITTSVPIGGSIVLNSIPTSTSGTVTITAATGATIYTVYISTTQSYTGSVYNFDTSTTGSAVAFTPSPALGATTYYAIVLPKNSFGNGSYSYSSSITTSVPTGGSIVLNSITGPTSGTVTITAATGATNYTVYISTTQSYTGSVYNFDTTTTGSAVAFTPSPALSSGTYYAIVLPKNSFGNGSYSAASSGVQLIAAPAGSYWIIGGQTSGGNAMTYNASANNSSFPTTSWTVATTSLPFTYSVGYNGTNLFIAGTTGGLYSSANLVTWASVGSGVIGSTQQVIYAAGKWFAVGSGTYTIAYSTDGVTWNGALSSSGGIFTSTYGIAYNGTNLFVAVGTGTHTVASSSVGTGSWVGGGSPIASWGWAVAYGNSTWVMVGNGGAGNPSLAYSSSGTSGWNTVAYANYGGLGTSQTYVDVRGIAYGLGYWVLGRTPGTSAGGNCTLWSSTNLTTWAGYSNASFFYYGGVQGITFNGTAFISGHNYYGSPATVMCYSLNGTTWSPITTTQTVAGYISMATPFYKTP
jgi:hypothetical protein